ncbi:GRZ1 protein, partial [Polypterus senegalus]
MNFKAKLQRQSAMLRTYWITITAVCVGLAVVSGEKIIDGTEAEAHSRPYMAFLKIKSGKNESWCGGFLILPNFILTAAHCQGESITVQLGVHNRSKKEKSKQNIPAVKIIPHECFNNKTLVNDIMLLKGDSGGPLVCPGSSDKPTAVGIVSYAPERCEGPGSNAYTMVSAYRDWIEMKISASSSA